MGVPDGKWRGQGSKSVVCVPESGECAIRSLEMDTCSVDPDEFEIILFRRLLPFGCTACYDRVLTRDDRHDG